MPHNPFQLSSPFTIITGGCSGIGLSITKLFHDQGAIVDVFDLQKPTPEQIAEWGLNDSTIAFHEIDITDQKRVKELVSLLSIERGIGLLINNAGIAHVGNAVTTSSADLDRIYQVNVKGAYNCMHAVLPFMQEQEQGVILNMASIAATVGISERFAYSMSKGAILSMTLSVARDFIKKGIRCNCISPARVHTPFVDGFLKKHYGGQEKEMFEKLSLSQPIGRMGTPEEIAHLAFYLCSKQAAFITGCDYAIDGGFTRINN
ncbi:MAG: SDR family oxidoreductase [Bacteroidetes bacterium]|nr:SDR family oxidoreductase [Bacteroidota bacterium]